MNYFEYFSEIEQRFSARRGSLLLLSTLDWALMETWREAGVPLGAVLRGIDTAFDRYEARAAKTRGRSRKVNGLAWCAQAVLEAAEQAVDASTGMAPESRATAARAGRESGFETARVATFLRANAEALSRADAPGTQEVLLATSTRLHELATALESGAAPSLEELDRALTVLEERLVLALHSAQSEADAQRLREETARTLAPYRAKMNVAQLRQVSAQFEHKRLLEARGLPRLSLFYMSVAE